MTGPGRCDRFEFVCETAVSGKEIVSCSPASAFFVYRGLRTVVLCPVRSGRFAIRQCPSRVGRIHEFGATRMPSFLAAISKQTPDQKTSSRSDAQCSRGESNSAPKDPSELLAKIWPHRQTRFSACPLGARDSIVHTRPHSQRLSLWLAADGCSIAWISPAMRLTGRPVGRR